MYVDLLTPHHGYWIKTNSSGTFTVSGIALMEDTIEVMPGWQLIGAISVPYSVSEIEEQPPGIVVSGYYGHGGIYDAVSVLEPGKGYWVKVKDAGKLIFSPK